MCSSDLTGARLYYEEAGRGHPVIFAHEFGGDYRSWETQMRWFSRFYRCITFNFRGYAPSDVPDDESLYSYIHFADDIAAVLKQVGVAKAHVVGLSQGAYAALQFGLRHKGIASALVLAGCGSGATTNAAERETFLRNARARGDQFLAAGTPDGLPPFSLLDGVTVNEVPEPATFGLVALGGLAWVVVRLRR